MKLDLMQISQYLWPKSKGRRIATLGMGHDHFQREAVSLDIWILLTFIQVKTKPCSCRRNY